MKRPVQTKIKAKAVIFETLASSPTLESRLLETGKQKWGIGYYRRAGVGCLRYGEEISPSTKYDDIRKGVYKTGVNTKIKEDTRTVIQQLSRYAEMKHMQDCLSLTLVEMADASTDIALTPEW